MDDSLKERKDVPTNDNPRATRDREKKPLITSNEKEKERSRV